MSLKSLTVLLNTRLEFDDTDSFLLSDVTPTNDQWEIHRAIVALVADPTTLDPNKAAYYTTDGQDAAVGIGMPLADGMYVELSSWDDIQKFAIRGTQAGKNHSLRVEFIGIDFQNI